MHGRSSSIGHGEGSVKVFFDSYQFPGQRYPLSKGFFRALIPLERGDNAITFETDVPNAPPQRKTLKLRYLPIDANPPVHFCLLLAKDSPEQFDALPDRVKREGGNNLGTAVKKMRMAAYMTSAFTLEQMNRNKCGMRSYKPYSQVEPDTLSCRDMSPRETAHIHIVRCNRTTAEIRDANIAQQNSSGKDTGALFGIAHDALKAYGEPFADGFVQAACVFLDGHWDPKQNLILGHAALGGGINNLKLAIFGSHAMWSWPTCLEDLSYACLDETKTDTRYVANDSNQSGTAWEALCVGMGAFQHEIGHLLGCPHEPSGVMLRGYLFWTRSFSALEAYSSRENRVVCRSPQPSDEDHWHRLDIMRFLHHPSFSLQNEPTRPSGKPMIYILNSGIVAQCPQGIYMVDFHVGGNSRNHREYDLVKELSLTLDDIRSAIPPEFRGKPIELHIHAAPMEQQDLKDVVKLIKLSKSKQCSVTLGVENGNIKECSLPQGQSPVLVRIYSGLALDGIEFIYPKGLSVLFGQKGGSPKDYPIANGDKFVGISLRVGAWVDAAGVITEHSRSPLWGGTGGGNVDLIPPNGYKFAGLKGWYGSWCNGIALKYCK